MTRRLRVAMLAVGAITTAWCAIAAPARSTYGARVAVDEPQYLLTAISLAEDRSLDVADELAEQRWRDFHRAQLPEQTKPLDGGRRLSPHDPLLPAILAGPAALGGWFGARLAMAAVAGLLAAAMVWVAARRLAVPVGVAVGAVLAFTLAAPLAPYGAQLYPELPAALAVTVAIGALTGSLGGRAVAGAVAMVVALPWLGVKYAPVAAVLAVVLGVTLLARGRRRDAVTTCLALAASAVAYLAFHRVVYGGWTVYAAGDHFVGGELTVAGSSPDVLGRSARLVGLLTDRSFGLAAWAPAWLLTVPAIAALARRRPAGWLPPVAALAAGWLMASFLALTMHGWWWPGRQVVVVLPAAVLAVAWWVAQVPRARPWLAAAAAVGVVTWVWVVVETLTLRLRLVIDFDASGNPVYRAWRTLLPDYRDLSLATWTLHACWVSVIAALAVVGWRSVSNQTERSTNHAHPRENAAPAAAGPDADPVLVGGGVR